MPLVTIPPQPFPPSSGKTGDIAERVTELETEVSGLETSVSNLQTTKANQTIIAPTFSSETAYNIGDLVFYNSSLYKCTTAHEGAWNAEHFTATTIENELDTLDTDVSGLETDVSNLQTTKANQITIAPTFNAESSYNIGDLVYYNGLTYKCSTAHTGAWDAGDFTATTIANELQNSVGGGVNYSTTEQNTGIKWIDNKDIYQKTYEVSGTYVLSNDAWTTIITDNSIDTLIDVQSINSDGTVSDGRLRWHFDTGNVQSAAISLLNLTDPVVTIYYTKVTT